MNVISIEDQLKQKADDAARQAAITKLLLDNLTVNEIKLLQDVKDGNATLPQIQALCERIKSIVGDL